MKKKRKNRESKKQGDTRLAKMLERMEAFRLTGKRPIGTKSKGGTIRGR